MAEIQQLQIIKLGGSLVTNKQRVATFSPRRMRRLAREVAVCEDPIILLHGTGSFGKPQARKYHYERDGFLARSRCGVVAEVSELLNDLRGMVVKMLREV